MKYFWVTCLVLGFATATEANAKAKAKARPDNDLSVEADGEVQFLKHYAAKIKALESYSVTFDDGSQVRGQHHSQPSTKKHEMPQVTLVSR